MEGPRLYSRFICSSRYRRPPMKNPLYSQEPERAYLRIIRSSAAVLEKARSEDVPTYAPHLFAGALELWERVQEEFTKCSPVEQVTKYLEQFLEKLAKAS